MQPRLRFKNFSYDINIIKFGDIFSFHTTNSYSRDYLNYKNGVVKNIHYGDIHTKFNSQFDITKESVPFINNDIDLKKIRLESYCYEGDVVIADASEDYKDIGKSIEIVHLGNEKLVAGLHTFLARPKQKLLAKGFISFAMQSYSVRHQIMVIAQGTKVLGISAGRLSEISIPLPSLEEQTKIASFLSVIEEKITQLTKKHELLKEYKKGVMQQIFSQELRFKADDGSAYSDWQMKAISELNLYISDGNYGEQYPTSAQMVSSGVPFLRANNIKGLKLTWDDMRYITPEHHKILTSGHLKSKDVLITTRGEIGSIALVTEEFEGANINAQICLLRVKDDSQIIPEFILQALSTKYSKKQFKELQTGSALKQLPKSNLGKVRIPTPCKSEQTKIANFLLAIDNKIQNNQSQLEATKQFKQGLLQQMFI